MVEAPFLLKLAIGFAAILMPSVSQSQLLVVWHARRRFAL